MSRIAFASLTLLFGYATTLSYELLVAPVMVLVFIAFALGTLSCAYQALENVPKVFFIPMLWIASIAVCFHGLVTSTNSSYSIWGWILILVVFLGTPSAIALAYACE